ncbi:STE family protein kinase [Trichomonas vaginalis G3]|uniref:non-specific serine/threonine protein kinase n=1 Tax=Trichomonas vaginalis (strain ATCC PRA-98 / G3) TaxID=412133 RepID=A2DIX8_TRIV3|nr:hippo signaling [Trichomonas vaginalis G3]EAY19553.1 STE family protein kinase [Trichomonas vaginalis G3]KAI5515870.1 hippo signaling [Trichomonas vaginalis G3]|eukprot:XP_001580539.1 STE family protein kinase [Trichomonas vaginalis G3]
MFMKRSREIQQGLSNPYEIYQRVHIDTDMNWTFDSTADPNSLFCTIKCIGKGGFGIVCEVLNKVLQQTFAGKIINTSFLDQQNEKTYQQEMKILRTVRSPYIIKYYGCVHLKTSRMLLMEFCDKGSLRQILDTRNQVLNEKQIAIVMHDLLMALDALHNKYNIIHRDIKAANLLFNSKYEIKLCDFGASIRKSDTQDKSNVIIGTPYWLAPEVISGQPYSYASDVWGTGITAVELAEGAPPYVEFPPTKAMIEISRSGFCGLREPSNHTTIFTSFIITCLKSNPEERPTVSELLNHPFIKQVETLNRKTEMSELLNVSTPDINIMGGGLDLPKPQPVQTPNHIPSSNFLIKSAHDLDQNNRASQHLENSSLYSLPSTLPDFSSSFGFDSPVTDDRTSSLPNFGSSQSFGEGRSSLLSPNQSVVHATPAFPTFPSQIESVASSLPCIMAQGEEVPMQPFIQRKSLVSANATVVHAETLSVPDEDEHIPSSLDSLQNDCSNSDLKPSNPKEVAVFEL